MFENFEAVEGEEAGLVGFADVLAFVEGVEEFGCVAVKADVPAPGFVLDAADGLDVCVEPEEVADPGFDDAGESVVGGLAEAHVYDGVETIGAFPVDGGVVVVEDIEIDLFDRRTGFGEQLANGAEAGCAGVHLDDFLVGEYDAAIVGVDGLLAEQELGCAQANRVGGIGQGAGEDDVDDLINKDGRYRDAARAHQVQVGAFERAGLLQDIAKAEHDAVVVGRVTVFEGGEAGVGHVQEWVFHQGFEGCDFGVAGLIDRVDLGAREVGADEVRCCVKPAGLVFLDQMEAG